MALRPKHKEFADEFMRTGSRVHSYQKVNPHVTYGSAATGANQVLRLADVQKYIEKKAERAAIRVFELSEQDENLPVALGASKDILDRAGFKPVEKSLTLNVHAVQMTPEDKALVEKYEEELRKQILQ